MRKLHKLAAVTLAAATALGTALPAQAQYYPDRNDREERRDRDDRWERDDDRRWDDRRDYDRRGVGIREQILDLQRRIERNDNRDRVSEREAAGLRTAVWRLRQQYHSYARNGLSRRESQILQRQINDVRQRLRYERRDGDNRRF